MEKHLAALRKIIFQARIGTARDFSTDARRDEVKAILCARGGYGVGRIIEDI